jgi:ketosteroid isomerase-like protein
MTMEPQDDSQEVAATIICQERAALDRWGRGDPSGFLEISAPDVVYFDPFIEKRIDGLDALSSYYESLRGQVTVASYELIDPVVQVAGPTAVLTFNYESDGGTGSRSRWNCTEVYRREPDGWRIIQTHWSLTNAAGQ